MGSKSNIMSYVSAVRCYLKKEEPEETEESPLFAQADNPGSTEIFISPSTGIQFVLIPAGEFEMGSSSEEKERSDSESPLHKVTIQNSFYLGRSAVTQKQWKTIMKKYIMITCFRIRLTTKLKNKIIQICMYLQGFTIRKCNILNLQNGWQNCVL